MHGGLSQFKATQQRRKERVYAKEKSAFNQKTDSNSSDKNASNFDFPKMSDAELDVFKKKSCQKKKI